MYLCVECNKKYKHAKSLRRHLETAHQGLRHLCQYCGQLFTRKDSLLDHIRNKHEKTLGENHSSDKDLNTGDFPVEELDRILGPILIEQFNTELSLGDDLSTIAKFGQ